MLAVKPNLRIVATLLAKNEADIIDSMMQHHIRQGVWGFIFTDNGSTDRTKEIVGKYKQVLEIIGEPGEDHNQSLWVTRMAQIACKYKPDWIIHLDADEFWCGLSNLREHNSPVVLSDSMFLHPPGEDPSYYLDFSQIPLPEETKAIHRRDKSIQIAHGNHGVLGNYQTERTKKIYRHHFPIRSLAQWEQKAKGHLALMKRDAPCARWSKWHHWLEEGSLPERYGQLVATWDAYKERQTAGTFQELLQYWATEDVIEFFKQNPACLPAVSRWQS